MIRNRVVDAFDHGFVVRPASVRCRRQLTRGAVAAALIGALVAPTTSSGATIAYWRHEEGAAGTAVALGPDTVLDSSGHGNAMQTFDPAFTAATYTSEVSPLALRSGDTNTRSLDFGPGGDDPGLNDDNFTDAKPINTQRFEALTVEFAFRMDAIGGFQALVGKDGQPTASPVPPFKVLVRGDDFPDAVPNQLFVEWIDGAGNTTFLASRETITVDEWNHVAFVLTADSAELWLADETSPYRLLDSVSGSFAGAQSEVLVDSDGSFTVGRGMFGGGVADWSDALIDEVRISDQALSPGDFLFVAVPEPTTACLVISAACLSVRRTERRRPRT